MLGCRVRLCCLTLPLCLRCSGRLYIVVQVPILLVSVSPSGLNTLFFYQTVVSADLGPRLTMECLSWSQVDDPAMADGCIAAGFTDGTVKLWNPTELLNTAAADGKEARAAVHE